MNVLLLGRGKTGSLVAEVAGERGHRVRSVGKVENAAGAALTSEELADVDVVIDFTTPQAALANIEATVQARKNMVVGTTGWYDDMSRVRDQVRRAGVGFLYAANFSIGVNLFFEVLRSLAPALTHGYTGSIVERHHATKKDRPSGTAVMMNRILESTVGRKLPIESIREGNYVGEHEVVLQSSNDVIQLAHSTKSRRGFAEGAVRAAEWLNGKKGFYDFKDVFQQMK